MEIASSTRWYGKCKDIIKLVVGTPKCHYNFTMLRYVQMFQNPCLVASGINVRFP